MTDRDGSIPVHVGSFAGRAFLFRRLMYIFDARLS